MRENKRGSAKNARKIVMKGDTLIIPRNDLSIRRSYTVEVPINTVTTGQKNKFLLNEFLQTASTGSVIYVGMETFINTQCAFSESGRPVVDATDAANLAITLKWDTAEILYLNPYAGFIALSNYGMIRRLDSLQFSLTDSYLQNLGPITAGRSGIFTFYFEPMPVKAKMP